MRRLKNTRRNRARGFTLVELLVVVAIIALLLSLLLPSLQMAREHAEKVVCMNNLHEMYLGVTMYANEYDGYCVPAPALSYGGYNSHIWYLSWGPPGTGYHPQTIWPSGYGLLYDLDLVKTGKIYYCPSEGHSGRNPYYYTYMPELFGERIGQPNPWGGWNAWCVWTYGCITWPLHWGLRQHVKLYVLTENGYPIVWDNTAGNHFEREIVGHLSGRCLNVLYTDGHMIAFSEKTTPETLTDYRLLPGGTLEWMNDPSVFQEDWINATKGL